MDSSKEQEEPRWPEEEISEGKKEVKGKDWRCKCCNAPKIPADQLSRGRAYSLVCMARADSYMYMTNRYMREGYRPKLTLAHCFLSIFHVHNETCNIWTHLIPAAVFLRWLTQEKSLVMRIPLTGALAVFTCSTLAHTLHAHSAQTSGLLFSLDRASIAFVAYTFTLASALMHFRYTKKFFMFSSVVTTAFLATAWFMLREAVYGEDPDTRVVKAFLLVANFCFAGVGTILEYFDKYDHPRLRSLILKYNFFSAASAILGLTFFITYFPEKQYGKRFPWLYLWGHSHSLMHIFTGLSIFLACKGIQKWRLFFVLLKKSREMSVKP